MAVRLKARIRLMQQIIGPEPVRTVMVIKNRQADRVRVNTGCTQLGNQHQIPARLTHLMPIKTHHARMRVVAGVRPVIYRPRMPRPQIMVRERQI